MITELETGDRITSTLVCSPCGYKWTRPLNDAGFIKRGNKPSCPSCGFTNPRDGIERDAIAPSAPAPVQAVEPAVVQPRRFNDGVFRHKTFTDVFASVSAGLPTLLVGPAGSGKSTIGKQIADELGLTFYTMSGNPLMTPTDLLGFVTPDGRYIDTIFVSWIRDGGVFVFDEMDLLNAATLGSLNAIMALTPGDDTPVYLPNGDVVKRHPESYAIAGANTWGTGDSDRYQREKLDAASLDRWVGIDFPWDETLETRFSANEAWTAKVQMIRKAVKEAGMDGTVLVSPRSSIMGAKLLASGLKEEKVHKMTWAKGMNPDTYRTIMTRVRQMERDAAQVAAQAAMPTSVSA